LVAYGTEDENLMMTQNSEITAKWLARGIFGLNGLMLMTAFGIVAWNGFVGFQEVIAEPFEVYIEIVGFVSAIVYTSIALLIVNQQPYHTVGWLFFIIGFGAALGSLAASTNVLSGEILANPIIVLLTWTESWTWILTFFILPSLVLLYFPDGQLPSQHWWPVLIVTLLGLGGYIAHDSFHPSSENPFDIIADAKFFAQLLDISGFMLALGFIGSLFAVFVRFRRSQGIARVQMKWLVYVAGLGISTMLLMVLVAGDDNSISSLIFASLPLLMAITIGTAILRHRLFDIDILIRRTLQYGLLTGLLALVYFGSVVILQSLIGQFTGEQSPAVIVISTLAIVVLFNPLRTRIQDFIDRRFYRQKYDAERALEEFAATARDEVELERLTEAMMNVVGSTMQPEKMSVWLVSQKTKESV
jgi:hypothetical protein